MASHRYALSSLNPELKSDRWIGFRFAPTNEELIRIVNKKNAGDEVHPMFKVYDDLFQRPPEQLEECYCFTKLKLLGKNKVDRTLRDGSGRYWKNQNKKSIGWVTKLKLHEDKNTTTEWHILEYRDGTERPEAGRYVLCHVYKLEKKNDSGRGYENQPQCSNAQPDWVSNAATNPSCPNPIDDFDMELLDDESFNQLLLELSNQGLPEF